MQNAQFTCKMHVPYTLRHTGTTYMYVRLSHVGLCSWVINTVRFYEVYCDVEPKRKALEQANSDLAAAQDKLTKIKAKIKVSDMNILRTH